MNKEKYILYESGDFYAYYVGPEKIEIRKNGSVCADLIGVVPTKNRAIRFIDRVAQYAHKFT
jgi:hypothetical protein